MPCIDKEKNREYQRKWYANNKKTQVKRVVKRVDRQREWFQELKKTMMCEICGEADFVCLEFHHRNPEEKEHNVSEMSTNGYSKEKILKEIEKCVIVCANCHRRIHHKERFNSH